MNTGVTFNLLMRQKSSMEKIMRQMLEEVIMSDGQIYSFLQLFFNTEKLKLNWRLDNTIIDYVLLLCTVINNEPLKIYAHPTKNTKKWIMQHSCVSFFL